MGRTKQDDDQDDIVNEEAAAEADQFPAFYFGPEGQSQKFESAGEVPEGWRDHPSKLRDDEGGNDGDPFVEGLPQRDEIDKTEIIRRLDDLIENGVGIEYQTRWSEARLYNLLRDEYVKQSRTNPSND